MKLAKMILAFSLMFMVSLSGFAQSNSSFQQNLESLAKNNAQGYMSPLVTATGIGLNSGLYRSAKVHRLLGFDISVNASGIVIPENGKIYTFDTSSLETYSFNIDNYEVDVDLAQAYPSVENAPTIFGSDESPDIEPNNTYVENTIVTQIANQSGMSENDVRNQYGSEIQTQMNSLPNVVPPGLNLDYAFVPSAQISLGLPFRTEAQVRYLPAYTLNDDLGELSLFGVGGRISLDQFIPVPFFPIDIAAGLFYQSMELGPVDINSTLLHAEVSKTLPFITVYGGVGLENSSLSAKYTLNQVGYPSSTVDVQVDGENQFRGTLGLRLKFLIFALNADYNMGTYNSATAGISLSFR